jgi:hypothetical protein
MYKYLRSAHVYDAFGRVDSYHIIHHMHEHKKKIRLQGVKICACVQKETYQVWDRHETEKMPSHIHMRAVDPQLLHGIDKNILHPGST